MSARILKERVIKNGRSTVVGFIGGALAGAILPTTFGITDWRVVAAVAGASAVGGALSKDPNWLKKKKVI